jgi:hypothetical protein
MNCQGKLRFWQHQEDSLALNNMQACSHNPPIGTQMDKHISFNSTARTAQVILSQSRDIHANSAID